jgi:steroid delta-isomerase-like uncharacterized protein
MSTKENKALVIRFEGLFNEGNLAGFDEVCSPDLVAPQLFPGQAAGLEGVKQVASMERSAFPDASITIEDLIAEDDKVVARSTLQGTHKGAFMGIPPTGKRISAGGIDIFRIAAGKIVEWWSVQDTLGLMQQLGVVPAMS